MKLLKLSVLGAGLALATLGSADEVPAPDPQSLASLEAILHKCADLDPTHAARYRSQATLLTQGVSDQVVHDLRQSAEYREAYDSATASIAAIEGKQAVKACMGSLAPTG